MAIDTQKIGEVYDALSEKVTTTLSALFDSFAISEKERAQVISNTISTLIQVSTSAVLEEPTRNAAVSASNAQILASKVQGFVSLANSQKDMSVKDAQIALTAEQTAAVKKEIAIKETQNTKDIEVKTAQKDYIAAQKATEIEKKALTTRQKIAYDDNLRLKEAEQLAGMVQMALVSGSTPDTQMVSKAYTAIDAITP